MYNKDFIELYKKLEMLIGYCYEKYKGSFTDIEKQDCETYLYEQGEYELALENFEFTLENHNITPDQESKDKMDEAKKLMNL